jgi:hypothetical protein
MQMRDSQFGTIVHPSIIKTNNLMMDSIASSKEDEFEQYDNPADLISLGLWLEQQGQEPYEYS